jgi:hypothetical protein
MGIGYHYLGGVDAQAWDNCVCSILSEVRIFLRIIDELNAAIRNNDFAMSEETRIK